MKKRIISVVLTLIMLCALISQSFITAEAASTVTNPSKVSGSDFSTAYAKKLDNIFQGKVALFSNTSAKFPLGTSLDNSKQYYVADAISGWQCYIYAQAVYYYLFGDIPFRGDGYKYWSGSTKVLSNKTTASYDLFKGTGVGFGAYLRTTSNSDGSYNGNVGHSIIILSYNKSTITFLEGNADGKGLVRITESTWSEFNSSLLTSKGRRISHIVQYNAAKNEDSEDNLLIKETYPSYCTIKATANTSAMTLPCSSSTDASSTKVQDIKKGNTYTAIELILNSQGNHWYKIQLSDGKTAYVPSSKMQFVEQLTTDLKISGTKELTTTKQGKAFSIEGKITSTYNNIKEVYAYVYPGEEAPKEPDAQKAETGGSATVNGKSYSLKGSAVDNKVSFGILEEGTYTYAVYVSYEGYYAKDEKTSASKTGTVRLHTDTFTVTSSGSSCSHSYSSKVTTAATCAQNGVKTYTCSKCKHSYTETIKATGDHSYTSKVTTEATCGQQGVMTYTCKTCGRSYTEYIPATGEHEYDCYVTAEPTCGEDGVAAYFCKICEFNYTVMLDATREHDYAETVIPANCTQMGQWFMECRNCGNSAAGYIPATGEHDYTGKVTTEATCASAGVRTYTCVDCGKSYTEAIPATGHDYKNGACTRCKQKDPNAVSTKNTKITVESKTVSSGSTVVLEVKIENNPGFSYLKLAAAFDSAVFEFVGATNGTVSTEDFEVSGKNILWSTDADSKEEGLLVTLTFHVKKDVKQGDYAIGVRPVECFNEEEAVVPLTVLNGVVSITDILYGDVNGDGDVNGRDMIRLKKYLANYDDETGISTVEIFGGADCNGDDQVNGRDLIRLKKYLANYDDETGSSTVVLGP